jgi:hypothetical protein
LAVLGTEENIVDVHCTVELLGPVEKEHSWTNF